MRPKLNKVHWKVLRLDIVIDKESAIAASSNQSYDSEDFLNDVADYLISKGYRPRKPIEEMRVSFKSPFSDSEYYTFLKIDEANRIKVVLDIRLADHSLKEWGNYSARDKHIHYMKTEVVPELREEFNTAESDPDIEFYDVIENESPIVDLISVDGTLFSNYSEAFKEVKKKIDNID